MTQRRALLFVALGAALLGLLGVLVRGSTMPAGMLLVVRMSIGGLAVAAVFGRRGVVRQACRPNVWPLLLLMGVVDAGSLLCTVLAIRYANVAVAMFLSYMAPVYVAVLAPRFLRQRAGGFVVVSLALALAGMALMLVPALRGETDLSTGGLSAGGVAAGIAAGLLLGVYFIIAKTLRGRIGSATMVLAECGLSAVFVAPFAAWQAASSGYGLTAGDAWRVLVLGIVCTAVPYMLIVTSMGYVPVQHVSILGYLEPVSAPLYALIFLGERPSPWTLAAGALILGAGVLVILRGPSAEASA